MPIIKISKENFASEVLNSEKTVLLDFYADWCPPCRKMGPVLAEIAEERSDIKIGKINVDEQPELVERFSVTSIPLLVVVEGGKVVNRKLGLGSKARILKML